MISATRGRGTATMGLAMFLLFGVPRAAPAQNSIASDGWAGFAVRTPDDRLDRCILYNRTVEALNLSQFEMLALTRDAAGRAGIMVFYSPRTLTRGSKVAMTLRVDQHEPVAITGEVPSDFHIIAGPLEPRLVAALREAKTINAVTQGHMIRFAVSGVGEALDALAECVRENGTQ